MNNFHFVALEFLKCLNSLKIYFDLHRIEGLVWTWTWCLHGRGAIPARVLSYQSSMMESKKIIQIWKKIMQVPVWHLLWGQSQFLTLQPLSETATLCQLSLSLPNTLEPHYNTDFGVHRESVYNRIVFVLMRLQCTLEPHYNRFWVHSTVICYLSVIWVHSTVNYRLMVKVAIKIRFIIIIIIIIE